MTISVVIPAYNEEKYLPDTLASLQKLDRKPDEIIVIDGGSTDKTADTAESYGATVVTVPHKGIGFARQKGLEAAVGDIIAYTDADTVVPSNWLNIIEETLSRNGVVGMFGTFHVPDGWWPYRLYINLIQTRLNQCMNWIGMPFACGQNMAFIRQKGLDAGGFPLDFKLAEDIEMARRLKTQGKVIYRPDSVVISSGRRGNEGLGLFVRIPKAFIYYFLFRKANKIGFPDMR